MDSADFAEKLREWPEPNLIGALRDYRDDYSKEQVEAIVLEIERRRATPDPPVLDDLEEEKNAPKRRTMLGYSCGAVCFLGALLFMLLCAGTTASGVLFSASAARAQGEVVRFETGGPVVRFKTLGGESVEFRGRNSVLGSFREGETVEVLYDSTRPELAIIGNADPLWLGPAKSGAIALALISAGLWCARKTPQRPEARA